MKKSYLKQFGDYCNQLRTLGVMAREIIKGFVKEKGGRYDFDEDEDSVWIDDEVHATSLQTDENGNILVFNSGCFSEYLHQMSDERILEIAYYICCE